MGEQEQTIAKTRDGCEQLVKLPQIMAQPSRWIPHLILSQKLRKIQAEQSTLESKYSWLLLCSQHQKHLTAKLVSKRLTYLKLITTCNNTDNHKCRITEHNQHQNKKTQLQPIHILGLLTRSQQFSRSTISCWPVCVKISSKPVITSGEVVSSRHYDCFSLRSYSR